MFRKSIKANKNVAKAPVDGIMKKIMTEKIINKADEKELLRSTELDESIKKTLKFNETFEDVLDKNTSAHQKMENKHLKDALTNIRKMLYKMEIMLIDKNLTGNLEDVEERLIQTFVKLSQKVPDASAPAADADASAPSTTADAATTAPATGATTAPATGATTAAATPDPTASALSASNPAALSASTPAARRLPPPPPAAALSAASKSEGPEEDLQETQSLLTAEQVLASAGREEAKP
jgi:hypothetical protein